MRVIILGSAAGGGVPQWNCACPNCTDARHDNRGRTQSSVAVSADGERWILLNASPDLRTQLAAHHELWPRGGGRRGSSIAAVILTDGEIDHTLRLLLMRESASRLPAYAPGGVPALLFGGTFWPDDAVRAGGGGDAPPAREMGHLPVGAPGGSLEQLPRLGAKRTVLVHINNTNPLLCRSSAERAQVEAAGITVGEDAMAFEL